MRRVLCTIASFSLLMIIDTAHAQFGGGGQLGGVRIDKSGLLRAATSAERKERSSVPELPEDLAAHTDLRQVSLRAVAHEAAKYLKSGQPIPKECALLAGLASVEYIILDEKNKDIRLAGPAEGWEVTPEGREVGRRSRRATIHLEDVATALRSVKQDWGEIMCSIDPRRDGLAAIQKVSLGPLSGKKDADKGKETVRKTLGRQSVRTGGVPDDSRFARVMVEADYMMKQMAIGEVVVKGVSNHLDAVMIRHQNGEESVGLARWWFVSDYAPLGVNASRTVFRIQGPHIKLLNEEMLLTRDGSRIGKGDDSKPDQFSQDFTAAFPDLETKFPSFSDLRNLYDLVLVATLLDQEGALDWLSDTVLLNEEAWPSPSHVVPREAEALAALSFHRPTKSADGRRSQMYSVAYGGVSMRLMKIQFDTSKGIIDPKLDKLGDRQPSGDSPKEPSIKEEVPMKENKEPGSSAESGREKGSKKDSWWEDLEPAQNDTPAQEESSEEPAEKKSPSEKTRSER